MWARGLEFESVPFFTGAKEVLMVPIEVEEILVFTSEGEDDHNYEQTVETEGPPHQNITFKTLLEKKKKQPFGNALARGFSQIIKHKKLTHNEDDFKILQIGKNMGNSTLSMNTMGNSTIDQAKAKSMFQRGSDSKLVIGSSFQPNFGKSENRARVLPSPILQVID